MVRAARGSHASGLLAIGADRLDARSIVVITGVSQKPSFLSRHRGIGSVPS